MVGGSYFAPDSHRNAAGASALDAFEAHHTLSGAVLEQLL